MCLEEAGWHVMVFDVTPARLDEVEFGGVGGQEEKEKAPCPEFCEAWLDALGLVNGVVVENDDGRWFTWLGQKCFEEIDEDLGGQFAVLDVVLEVVA